ncbi:MAG: cytochrome bd-I oxidase subunit CydX [Phenylobacterium sp.]
MWYFTWNLGLGLAVAFAVLNGMWHEFHLMDSGDIGDDDDEEEHAVS